MMRSSPPTASPRPMLLGAQMPLAKVHAMSTRPSALATEDDGEEWSDLAGLRRCLDALAQDSLQLVELVYVVNHWTWKGVVPLQHHGLIFKVADGTHLSLDF